MINDAEVQGERFTCWNFSAIQPWEKSLMCECVCVHTPHTWTQGYVVPNSSTSPTHLSITLTTSCFSMRGRVMSDQGWKHMTLLKKGCRKRQRMTEKMLDSGWNRMLDNLSSCTWDSVVLWTKCIVSMLVCLWWQCLCLAGILFNWLTIAYHKSIRHSH